MLLPSVPSCLPQTMNTPRLSAKSLMRALLRPRKVRTSALQERRRGCRFPEEAHRQADQIENISLNVRLSQRAVETLANAPLPVQKAFIKQISFLIRNLAQPSLHAKKYDEANDRWQARINDDWRLYFTIRDDTYYISDLMPHPK